MLPHLDYAKKMARVLLEVGIEIKEGQPVFIETPVEAYEFISILVHEAYECGASDVFVLWLSDKTERENARHNGVSDDWMLEICRRYAERKAGYIRIMCPSFNEDELDPELVNGIMKQKTARRKLFRQAGGGFTLTCIPTDEWADKVFPELEQEDRMEALWDLVYNLMKCPDPDPVASWREYIRNTEKRKKALDSRGYVKYRYRSGRTDLTLSPADEAIWFGGCNRYIDRVFIPNLPTEEIFTVPQKFSAEGHVESTMPLNYDGRMIEGIKIDFHEGKAVSVHADKGEDILREIIASDEGASYLGEFALVDQASCIASSGKILYTTLYDENASCHIALGTAAGQMPEGRDEELGVNRSCVHVDFMIGSDDMTVEAEKADGTWERILVNGRWNDKVFEN